MKRIIIIPQAFIITITLVIIFSQSVYLQTESRYLVTFDDSLRQGVQTPMNDYEHAYKELKSMLHGKRPLDFERAIFITENVYYQNRSNYADFQRVLDWHTLRIVALMQANDRSDTIDFKTYTNFREHGSDITSLRYTENQKRELYYKALANWAIFTYLTDTVRYGEEIHIPFTYRADDPFAIHNWGHSQVIHMLSSPAKNGNCFAFAALFKIFSDRLGSDAYICTAPQHIYIQHKDIKGHWYNVELPTRTFPDDGTITTLTYTNYEGIMGGLSVRKLENTKQNVVLCLINLGKSYEHRFGDKGSNFAMQCAELALQHDSMNLNAWLLKHQVLGEQILKYIQENNVTDITTLQGYEPFQQLEQVTLHLYDKGYREMPRYMQEIVLSKMQNDSLPSNVQDRTPSPFTSITVPEKSKRYSTISGGLYEEVYEQKDTELYGYFIFDTKQKRLTGVDTTYRKDMLTDPVVFAWAVDPMAYKFPTWSPYAAFNDNPIYNIDIKGSTVTPAQGVTSGEFRVIGITMIQIAEQSTILKNIIDHMYSSSTVYEIGSTDVSRHPDAIAFYYADDYANSDEFKGHININAYKFYGQGTLRQKVALSEEIFHAGQDQYKRDQGRENGLETGVDLLEAETEVRVFRAYSGFVGDETTDEQVVRDFAANPDVQAYFGALRSGNKDDIAKYEAGFRTQVGILAKGISDPYASYEELGIYLNDYEQGGFQTPYFDKLTKDEGKQN